MGKHGPHKCPWASEKSGERKQYMAGVPNRFGGMRDLHGLFLWRYSGCELKTGAGSGNFNYERERDFVF